MDWLQKPRYQRRRFFSNGNDQVNALLRFCLFMKRAVDMNRAYLKPFPLEAGSQPLPLPRVSDS